MEHTPKEPAKKPKFVRWAVMVGIVVALNIFFLVARTQVLQPPSYDAYCPAPTGTSTPQNPQACSNAGGIWNDESNPSLSAGDSSATGAPQGYCDVTAKCQASLQAATDQYELYSFVIEVGLGILAIIIGVLPLGSSIVSTGLTYGGVIAFIVASAQYWTDSSNWLRLGISVIALVALIYIGIRRFKD